MLFAISAMAQDSVAVRFYEWNAANYDRAKSAERLTFLRPDEKELIRLINLLRMNPALYGKTYLQWYSNIHDTASVRKMQAILAKIPPMLPLESQYALCKAAFYQAYLKATGQDEGGSMPFYERLHQFYPGCRTYATDYLPNGEFPILMINKLLLDSTKVWHSHILSRKLTNIGVSIAIKPDQCFHTVLDFSSAQVPLLPPPPKKKLTSYEDECPKGSKVAVRKSKRKHRRFIFW